MADSINTIKNAVNTELTGYIQTAITPFVSQEQGTFVGEGRNEMLHLISNSTGKINN
jgi:hypothetical protein